MATPAATPDTTPVPLIVAMVAGAEVHVPPVVPSVKGVVASIHMLLLPLMAAGDGTTLTLLYTVQPVPSE